MKEEEKKKKSNKKIIMAVVLIAIIAITLAFYFKVFSLPTGFVAATERNTENANPSAPTPQEPPKFTITGSEVIAKEITDSPLPYYEILNLESGKYSIQFSTDKPVDMRIFDEANFVEWEKTGKLGSSLVGAIKTSEFSNAFFVPNGYGGKYYLLFLGNDKTSIKFKIEQILKT